MNANIFEKANQIVKACDTTYFGVIDENGYPSVSTISPINPESILEIFASTNIGGNKGKCLRKDRRASICFRSGNDNITLVGDAEIVVDQETKSRCWQEWFINRYPGGETDPNYIIINSPRNVFRFGWILRSPNSQQTNFSLPSQDAAFYAMAAHTGSRMDVRGALL